MALADTAELVVALTLRDKLSGGLRNLNSELKGMQGGLRDVGRGIGQVGSGLDRIATRGAIAAVGGLTAVVTTAASFEQAFTGVEKTVDGTDAQLKELEDTVRQMARTMPISFEELSAIGEAGGALGIARDSLDEFIDVVARLSVSTDLSSDQAATALGQLGNVLHLTGADFEDFADSLVALGNAGASTESQIVDIAARFGAAGNAAGLSKEEILALSSAVASMGIEAEAGGSSLSRIFTNVATAIGTGGDEVEAFTETMGISADEFQKRWGEDALGTFQDFLVELGKLDQFGQARVLEEAGITGVRDQQAVRLMAQNVGFLGDQLQIAEEATGALDKESQKFFDTTQGQWKILQNNVRDAGATIGAELLPVVNEVMGDLVEWLQDPATQRGIKEFADNLAGGVRDLVTEIKNADFGPLIDTLKGAAGIAKGAFDAFRSLPQPIQQLALAAIVANKVTGGAVGSIASGLGNILKGVIKIGFDRGASPINPMWVKSVGGPLGGGPGGTGGPVGAGGRGPLGWALAALGVVSVAALANEIEPTITKAGQDLNRDLFGGQNLLGIDPSELQWPFGPKNTPTILPEIFGGNGLLGGTAAPTDGGGRSMGGGFLPPELGDQGAEWEATRRQQQTNADQISDQVRESGAAWEETTRQQMGDTRSTITAEMTPLKAQSASLTTITEREAARASSSDTAMLQTASRQQQEMANTRAAVSQLPPKFDGTNARLSGLGTKIDGSNATLARIAAKNFSPVINLTPRFNLSTSVLAWGMSSYKSVTGAPQRIL